MQTDCKNKTKHWKYVFFPPLMIPILPILFFKYVDTSVCVLDTTEKPVWENVSHEKSSQSLQMVLRWSVASTNDLL